MIIGVGLISALSLHVNQLYAQEDSEIKKNVIVGTLGLNGLGGTALASYERNVKQFDAGSLNLRASIGGWAFWDRSGRLTMLSTSYLKGKHSRFLEIGASIFTNYDRQLYSSDYYDDFSPVPDKWDYIKVQGGGYIGYRIQNPQKPYMFRVGAGFPDGLYGSFGLQF